MRKNVSLKDIANVVGVSVSLVSYVLNGHAEKKRVGDAIAKKIQDTAKKLHYHPNQIAKSLKTRKSNTIGLIVGNIHYRFTTGVAQAVEAEAKKSNYTVIIGNTHEDHSTFSDLLNVLIHRQVDGLIIVAVENAEQDIKLLKDREIPFVLIDRNFPKLKTNFIGIDNYMVAYKATDYLIRHHCRHISFINYKTTFFHLNERNRGYIAALKDNGLAVSTHLHKEIRTSHQDDDVKLAIRELVSDASPCDAIFFSTGNIAIMGLKNIIDLKVKIPKDISIISFDDSEAFALFYCPITHFRQPLEDIGKSAIKLLFEVMKENKGCKQLLLESTFVKGKSCGE